jgi:hypothetical protein
MPRREEVDLSLALTDPSRARKYIEEFPWGAPLASLPEIFTTDEGRDINIKNMTDEEAVTVALDLLRNFEIPGVLAQFKMSEALKQIC